MTNKFPPSRQASAGPAGGPSCKAAACRGYMTQKNSLAGREVLSAGLFYCCVSVCPSGCVVIVTASSVGISP